MPWSPIQSHIGTCGQVLYRVSVSVCMRAGCCTEGVCAVYVCIRALLLFGYGQCLCPFTQTFFVFVCVCVCVSVCHLIPSNHHNTTTTSRLHAPTAAHGRVTSPWCSPFLPQVGGSLCVCVCDGKENICLNVFNCFFT